MQRSTYNATEPGLLTAIVVAIDYPLIYYSENARAYSLVVLCFAIFIIFFIRIYRGDNSITNIFMLGFSAALCMWAHYFVAVGIIVALLLLLKKDWIAAIGSFIIMVMFTVPMALMFNADQFGRRIAEQSSGVALNWYNMAGYLPNELLCWMWIIIIPASVYTVIKSRDRVIRALAIIGITSPVVLVLLTFITGWLMPRYAIQVAPIFIILAMCPFSKYLDKLPVPKKAALAALVIFGLFILNFGSLYNLWSWSWCSAMGLPVPMPDAGFI